jgi:hypothetical protein
MKLNIISVNLNKYSTVGEYKKLFEQNNLSLKAEAMVEMRAKFSKVFIDTVNSIVISVVLKDGSYALTEEMEKFLSSIQPLSMKNKNEAFNLNFNVDDLLDKINESGIDSLTSREKLFLKENSSK